MKIEHELASKKALESFNKLMNQHQEIKQEFKKNQAISEQLEEAKCLIVSMGQKTRKLEGKLSEERRINQRRKEFGIYHEQKGTKEIVKSAKEEKIEKQSHTTPIPVKQPVETPYSSLKRGFLNNPLQSKTPTQQKSPVTPKTPTQQKSPKAPITPTQQKSPEAPKTPTQPKLIQPQEQQETLSQDVDEDDVDEDDEDNEDNKEFDNWFDKVGKKMEGSEYGLLLDWKEDKEKLKALAKKLGYGSCCDSGFSTSEDSSKVRKRNKYFGSGESEDLSEKSEKKIEHKGSKRKELRHPLPEKKRKRKKKKVK